MANTTGLPVLFATGNHAGRPAASAVGAGGLYSCTTHSLVYQTDGSSWTTWATVGGASTRASLGLDTTDSPQFAGLNVGAATDTTITRTGAGDIAVEGNILYRAGGTDVPIADGGTGASTKAAAFDALSPMTTQDDLIIGGASGTGTRLAKGSDSQVLTVDPSTHHLVWATPSSGFTNPMTTKGDVIVGDTGGTAIRKAVGSDGQVLTADAASTGGIKWAAAGGGGGGLTQSFIGYNTVGGSQETLTVNRQLMKSVTIASAGTLVSIDMHVQATATDPTSFICMVLEDSSGLPTLVRGAGYANQLGLKGGNAARWLSIPLGTYLASGTYWIGITPNLIGGSGMKLSYDTSGSDRYVTVGGFALDGDYTTTTDSTRKYSIRANFLS